MRRMMTFAGLPLAAALLFGAATAGPTTNGNDNRNSTAAAHAAAVRRCRDAYNSARAAAMRIKTQPERDAALAKAQRDYDACKKSADTARY
jgi:hypothetical protein